MARKLSLVVQGAEEITPLRLVVQELRDKGILVVMAEPVQEMPEVATHMLPAAEVELARQEQAPLRPVRAMEGPEHLIRFLVRQSHTRVAVAVDGGAAADGHVTGGAA